MASTAENSYYVPESSPWPLSGSIGMCFLMVGIANILHGVSWGPACAGFGALWLVATLFFWWRDTIKESIAGLHEGRLAGSYRQGMLWFIFSEVTFFGALFGALFYTRWLVIPWLAGEGNNAMTHELLWPDFQAMWPLTVSPEDSATGTTTTAVIGPWGLPLLNTAILLTSSITLTIAHHALIAGDRKKLIIFQAATVDLGVIFLCCQVLEYVHAYDIGLTFDAGIYGSLFFMMTGFHGIHVTMGTIMLTICLFRILKGHFSADNHFVYEASAWYWHFVDVVWLFLFFVVYWM